MCGQMPLVQHVLLGTSSMDANQSGSKGTAMHGMLHLCLPKLLMTEIDGKGPKKPLVCARV